MYIKKMLTAIACLVVQPTAGWAQTESVDCNMVGFIAGGFARQNNALLAEINRGRLLDQLAYNVTDWGNNKKIDSLSKSNIIVAANLAFNGQLQDDAAFEQEITKNCEQSRNGLVNPN